MSLLFLSITEAKKGNRITNGQCKADWDIQREGMAIDQSP